MDDLFNTFVPENTKKFVNHLSGSETSEEKSLPVPSKRNSKSITQKEQVSPTLNDVPTDSMTLEQ